MGIEKTITYSAERRFTFSFVCDYCSKNSGPKEGKIFASATSGTMHGGGKLVEGRHAELQEEAHKALIIAVSAIQQKINKDIYPNEINGKCPFCHKRQKWDSKYGVLRPWVIAGLMLFVGFIAIPIYIIISGNPPDGIVIFAPVILFFLGLIFGYSRLHKVKSAYLKSPKRNKPTIILPLS